MAQPVSEWRTLPKPPGMTPAEERHWHEVALEMRQRAERVRAMQVAAQTVVVRKPGGYDYFDDPVAWVHDCIVWSEGQGPTPYQDEILQAVIDHHKVAVRSLHGAAKTATMSWLVHWFADTRDRAGADWKVPTTASVWDQLKHYLWPEIHKWAKRLRWDVLGREPYDARTELLLWNLKLAYGQAFAISPDDPAHIEGAHADQLLFIYDESKAVSDATFDATAGAFSTAGEGGTTAYAVAMSTPGEPIGRFYQIHARAPGTESWWVRHITLEECIRAGRVTREYAEESARLWGEESAIYKNRVLGEFASANEDGVIPLGWVEAAIERWKLIYEPDGKPTGRPRSPREGTRAVLMPGDKLHTIGVDVARGGEDKTVLALRQGNTIAELRRLAYTDDTMSVAGHVVGIQRGHGEPRAIIDVIGVGAGVFDRVREQALPCSAFNASEGTKRTDQTGEFGFTNKRSWAWWNLREMLDPGNELDLALPPDDLMIGDLLAPRWKLMSGGRIQVESKDDIRKRIGRSTDTGDGVVQAYTEGGGSWADLYRQHVEEEVDDGVPKPRQKPARSGRWDFGAGTGREEEDAAEAFDPESDEPQQPALPAPAPQAPPRRQGGYFASPPPPKPGPPRSGWITDPTPPR